MRRRGPIALAACALLVLTPRSPRPRLVWNATASAPIGLYGIRPPTALKPGDLVLARPPAAAAQVAARRHYLPIGVPLVKRIAALPGEPVCALGATLRGPRGLVVFRLRRDAAGRILPWWRGCGRLGPNAYLLVMAHVPDSFDGRYFGPVARGQILGKAHPIWLL